MLIVLIPLQGKMSTPLSHLSWPVPLLSPQCSCITRLTFQFASPITGILWAAGRKAIEPHSICSLSCFQSIYDFLKILKRLCRTKTSYILFFFLTLHFDCTHPPPLPPSSASPGHLCTLIWESNTGARGGNNSTWKWVGDCLPPSLVMEGLSDRAPQAPPWWLISCGALELRSDTLAHQTQLSLSGTPLIARCFIIVPCSALVSGATSSTCHTMLDFSCCFSECTHIEGKCHRGLSSIWEILITDWWQHSKALWDIQCIVFIVKLNRSLTH